MEPVLDGDRQTEQILQELLGHFRFLGLVDDGGLIGDGFDAGRQFAGQSLAFLVVRQNSAEQKPHQEHVRRHNPGEQRIQRNHFPAEPVGDQF